MKKPFIIIILLFSISFSNFAEEFKGFLGIPFGTQKIDVYKTLTNKGWKLQDDIDICLFFAGKQYAGKDIKWFDVFFENNCFSTVTIYFENPEDEKEVMAAMIKKYELDTICAPMYFTPDDRYCFFDGDDFLTISDTVDYSSTIESDI